MSDFIKIYLATKKYYHIFIKNIKLKLLPFKFKCILKNTIKNMV